MATNKKYTVKVKRKRLGLTNYKKRLKYISSNLPRIVIRTFSNNMVIQLVTYNQLGDKILLTTTSSTLRKFGWKGHNGNLPAAYLTGLLFGSKLSSHKVKKAIVDAGLTKPIKGSRFYAAIKGILDSSSIELSCSEEVLPSNEAISGKKISEFASMLSKNPDKYQKQFSFYLKNNLKPESLQNHVEEIKNKILGGKEKSAKAN